jgi:hypothetical protein
VSKHNGLVGGSYFIYFICIYLHILVSKHNCLVGGSYFICIYLHILVSNTMVW